MKRGIVFGLLLAAVIAALSMGCATGTGAENGEEPATDDSAKQRPVDCVITDAEGNVVEIRQCYVETGPQGVAENLRIPIVETTTKTRAGEFTYPLKFELEVTDKGKIRLIGPIRRPEGDEGSDQQDPPAEAPAIDEEDGEGENEGAEDEGHRPESGNEAGQSDN